MGKLRQIEVVSQGKTMPLACKDSRITDQTYYRWRKEYGGLQLEQAKTLKDLQRENAQLKRACSDADAGKADSEGYGRGKLLSPARRRFAVNTHGTSD